MSQSESEERRERGDCASAIFPCVTILVKSHGGNTVLSHHLDPCYVRSYEALHWPFFCRSAQTDVRDGRAWEKLSTLPPQTPWAL